MKVKKIVGLFLLVLISTSGYGQEDRTDTLKKWSVFVGLDVGKTLFYPLINTSDGSSVTIEPLFKFVPPQAAVVWLLSGGYSKYEKTTVYQNLMNYSNEGFYFKAGIEFPAFSLRKVSYRFSANIFIGNNNENGQVYFKNDYFGDTYLPFHYTKASGGVELSGNLYIPIYKRLYFCFQTTVGKAIVPIYNNNINKNNKYEPEYLQGIGRNLGGDAFGLSFQLFYKIK